MFRPVQRCQHPAGSSIASVLSSRFDMVGQLSRTVIERNHTLMFALALCTLDTLLRCFCFPRFSVQCCLSAFSEQTYLVAPGGCPFFWITGNEQECSRDVSRAICRKSQINHAEHPFHNKVKMRNTPKQQLEQMKLTAHL